jgi:transposase InsO family protein
VKFGFIAKHRGIWPVRLLCEALDVSRSGFYAWAARAPSVRARSDERVGALVKTSFLNSDRTYGARRVWYDVLAEGIACGLHRIERLMRAQALRARPRRRRTARLTPAQRHQAERTGIDVAAIPDIALKVWLEAETDELEAAFATHGLRLCHGDKAPVLVDIAGGVHNLPRAVGKASAARGRRIPAAEVKQRISQIKLPTYNAGGEDGRAETPQGNTAVDAERAAAYIESATFGRSENVSGSGARADRRSRAQSHAGRRAARAG